MFLEYGDGKRPPGRHLCMIGLNHKTADIGLRERLAVTETTITPFLHRVRDCPSISGAAVLSTCHRTELYLSTTEWLDRQRLRELLIQDRVVLDHSEADELYVYRRSEVPRHLFAVSGGLDSVVLGEGQILGQVKRAYTAALDLAATDAVMNRLFAAAIETGKRVREETNIGRGAVSLAQAAAVVVRNLAGDLSEVTALIVGAGHVAGKVGRHLRECGVREIWVCARSGDRARELADALRGKVLPWDSLGRRLEIDARIVLCATASPIVVLSRQHVGSLVENTRASAGKPVVCLDLGMPRNIDESAASLAGVVLRNLDDLRTVVAGNVSARTRETDRARTIIDDEVRAFEAWRGERRMAATIARMMADFENIRQRELAAITGRFPEPSRSRLEAFSRRLVGAALHRAIGDLKRSSRDSEVEGQPEDDAAAVKREVSPWELQHQDRAGRTMPTPGVPATRSPVCR